ncbi:MAG: hypothetical protein P4N59_04720 [Negativicutes bacterium]|nr:hypothetical protein [Negativicutes bacterium]
MNKITTGNGRFAAFSPKFLCLFVVVPILLLANRGWGQDSIIQITAEAKGLTLVPPDQLPALGTFWLVVPAGRNGCSAAPLPTPPFGFPPTFQVADGQFIVDGTVGETASQQTLEAQASFVVNLINQIQGTQVAQLMRQATAMGAPGLPGFGDGGGSYGDNGLTNNPAYNYSFNTNLLWLQITNVSNGTASGGLFHATNQVYAIWATPDLTIPFSLWSVGTEVFPSASTTNVLPFAVPTFGEPDLFLRAEDWTGVYANGLPVWWTWYYFHTLNLNATNSDGQGSTLGDDYTNQWDPNVINFFIMVTNLDVNTGNPNLPLNIISGTPASVAVLVNDANLSDAAWQPYTGPNVLAPLGADGYYSVAVGLRGFPANATETWQGVDLTKNTVPPRLTITSPTNSTVSQIPVQFQGYATRPLTAITFDLSNANGTISGQPAFLTGQYYDTTLMASTTNYFQSDDIYLAGGTNIVTIHATDWAGNQTNMSLTLNYPAGLTAPVVSFLWPTAGMVVSGNSLTLQMQVNNPAATVSATSGSTSIQGLVERSGTVWVHNLPLVPGANNITITASDANGHMATTTLSVTDNNMGLGIDALTSAQLNQPSVNVYGEIGSPSVSLVVNGITANNRGNGTWEADGVPVSPAGTAIINAQVFSNGVNIASQSLDQVQPVVVALMSYSGHQTFTDLPNPPGSPPPYFDSIDWSYKTGGTINDSYDDPLYLAPATNGTGYLPILYPNGGGSPTFHQPWEFTSLSVCITNDNTLFQSKTEPKVMIVQGGQAQPGTTNLYLVMARACEFSDANIQGGSPGYGIGYSYSYDDFGNNINPLLPYGGDVGLPPEWLKVNGHTLVNTGITNNLSAYSGPSIRSVWGATIVAAPAGQNWEITATATNVYHHWDYNIFEQASNLTFRIIDKNTGQNLSAQTNTVIVGQQMNLTYQFSLTNSITTNLVVTNFQWAVPGYAISNYVVSSESISAFVRTNFSTNNAAAKFCWVDGASNCVVRFSATVNGTPLTAQATFNVRRPSATLAAIVTGQIRVDDNYLLPGMYLHFGGDTVGTATTPGIKFQINGVDTNGTYFFVQTGSSSEQQLWSNGTNYIATDGPGLDNGTDTNSYVYRFDPSQGTNTTDDSPAQGLLSNLRTISETDSYTMYLMFTPTNVIGATPVPLQKVDWSWSAAAIQTDATLNLWALTTNSPPSGLTPVKTTAHPQWTNNLLNSWHWTP